MSHSVSSVTFGEFKAIKQGPFEVYESMNGSCAYTGCQHDSIVKIMKFGNGSELTKSCHLCASHMREMVIHHSESVIKVDRSTRSLYA